jgi:di/tricarboxylate transporter
VDVAGLFMIVALGISQSMGLGILGQARSPDEALLVISGLGQPLVLILVGLFILTQALSWNGVMLCSSLAAAALSQVMGSQSTSFIIGPITISAELHPHAKPHAIAVATAIGCSAAFLTPIAHPVSLIMMD